MTRLATFTVGACLAALLPAAALAQEPVETFLFTETAPRATMADGVLTLSGIDGTIVCFSDRPFRHGEVVPVSELVGIWDKGADSFVTDPPNAAVTGSTEAGAVTLVLELMNPVLDGDEIAFNYVLLHGEPVDAMTNVALLIDAIK